MARSRTGDRRGKPGDPCTLAIFGASGDLAKRKLFPALLNLKRDGLLRNEFAVLGLATSEMTSEAFRERLTADLHGFAPQDVDSELWKWLSERTYYVPGNFRAPEAYKHLAEGLRTVQEKHGTHGNVLFYLATPPDFFGDIVDRLGEVGLAALLKARRVRKIICSFPRQTDSYVFDALFHAGEIELELVPQGNLAERIRAAGAGIGAFFTPTAYGTPLAEGKETRLIDGRGYVLEYPIAADFALIKADKGDRWGNLVYRKTARNFGPIMASAAKCAIAQVREIVPLGELDPEVIVTPGIFVQRVVAVDVATQRAQPQAAA